MPTKNKILHKQIGTGAERCPFFIIFGLTNQYQFAMRNFFISLFIIASMPALAQTKTEVYAKIEQLLNETTDLYYIGDDGGRNTVSNQIFNDTFIETWIRPNENESVNVKKYEDINWNKFKGYKMVELKKGNYKLFEVQLNFNTKISYKEYTSPDDATVIKGSSKVVKVYISERFKEDLEAQLKNLEK